MVRIIDIVPETYSNESGNSLYVKIKDFFDGNTPFELSFEDISCTSSSFLNSSFGSLIEEFGVEKFVSLVKPKNLTKGEADILKSYVGSFKRLSK
jgi:hypothetical protein